MTLTPIDDHVDGNGHADGHDHVDGNDHLDGHDHVDAHDHVELPWYHLPDYRCFGCSPHNPNGFQLRFTRIEGGLRTSFRLGRGYESYPGVVHGGLLGVICDEIMGNLIVLEHGRIAFTTGMRMRYVLPVGVGQPYECVARLRDSGAVIHTDAEIRDAAGALVAMSSASYQTVPLEVAGQRLAISEPELGLLRDAFVATGLTPAPAAPAVPDQTPEESHAHHD
jgi:acyl-coenzyme A thioesterase PaaI-like protein